MKLTLDLGEEGGAVKSRDKPAPALPFNRTHWDRWTPREDELLKRAARTGITWTAVAEMTGLSPKTVKVRADTIGAVKNPFAPRNVPPKPCPQCGLTMRPVTTWETGRTRTAGHFCSNCLLEFNRDGKILEPLW